MGVFVYFLLLQSTVTARIGVQSMKMFISIQLHQSINSVLTVEAPSNLGLSVLGPSELTTKPELLFLPSKCPQSLFQLYLNRDYRASSSLPGYLAVSPPGCSGNPLSSLLVQISSRICVNTSVDALLDSANAASAVQTGQFLPTFAYEANKQAAAAVNATIQSYNKRNKKKKKPILKLLVQIFVPWQQPSSDLQGLHFFLLLTSQSGLRMF